MSALAGGIADPGAYNTDIKKLIARAGPRTSNSTSTTTEQSVLELDSVPVKSGRAYRIEVPPLHVSGGAADVVAIKIRHTTDDSTPTTSSTVLRYMQTTIRTGTPDEPISLAHTYFPSSDVNLSLLLTVARVSGTAGNALIVGNTDKPISILVWDMGIDPGDTGISL